MIINNGDYILSYKMYPGLIIDLYAEVDINAYLRSIDTEQSYIQYVKAIVYYEDEETDSYTGTIHSNINYTFQRVITENEYSAITSIPKNIIELLYSIHERYDITYYDFLMLYINNREEAMKYISIKTIYSRKLVEFIDGSIWICDRIKLHKNRRGLNYPKRKYKYIPKIKIYGY